MSEPKFTKGPWATDFGQEFFVAGRKFIRASGVDGKALAAAHQTEGMLEEVLEANAALIASAPNLYEAADQAEDKLDFLLGAVEPYQEGIDWDEVRQVILNLRRALKKARGE